MEHDIYICLSGVLSNVKNQILRLPYIKTEMCGDPSSFTVALSKKRHTALYVCCCLIICFSLLDVFQEELAAKVAEQQAAVMAAGLLEKKESEDSSAVIGPSMQEPEPFHTEVKATVFFFFLMKLYDASLSLFFFCLCKTVGQSVATYCIILLYLIIMASPKRVHRGSKRVHSDSWRQYIHAHFGLTPFVLCIFDRLLKM